MKGEVEATKEIMVTNETSPTEDKVVRQLHIGTADEVGRTITIVGTNRTDDGQVDLEIDTDAEALAIIGTELEAQVITHIEKVTPATETLDIVKHIPDLRNVKMGGESDSQTEEVCELRECETIFHIQNSNCLPYGVMFIGQNNKSVNQLYKCVALIDSGASRSIINDKLVTKFNLKNRKGYSFKI